MGWSDFDKLVSLMWKQAGAKGRRERAKERVEKVDTEDKEQRQAVAKQRGKGKMPQWQIPTSCANAAARPAM